MARIHYSEELRQDALRQVLEDHVSVRSVAEQVGCNVNSIYVWLRRYRQDSIRLDQKSDATFVPVRLVDHEHNGNNRIELTLPNGLAIGNSSFK